MPHTGLSERGVALLVVVSILTVVAIMGVSFAFSMYLETQAARQFADTVRARYIAEAGISHARAVLDEDRLGTRTDDLTEGWVTGMSGADVDVDGDGELDARGWELSDGSEAAGRYAVMVGDEAGKINLNTGVGDPGDAGVAAPNLRSLLSSAGLPASLADAIEAYRYGPDQRPGAAQVDDDHDGSVDEPGEYRPLALVGDDRRIESLEELLQLDGMSADGLKKLARVATVYSWDENVTLTGAPRLNVNSAAADEILGVVLESGAEDPWQMAVNMADTVDSDFIISKISKSSVKYLIPDQGDQGGWEWAAGLAAYVSDRPAGQPLSWTINAPPGEYRVLVHGAPGYPIGDVNMLGETKTSMESGDVFGVVNVGGLIVVRVTHHEPQGVECAFRGIQLVPVEGTGGLPTTVVRGIEAVRINEVMVSPSIELLAEEGTFDPQTSGWGCPVGIDGCINSGTGQARWSWTNDAVRSGRYHARLYGVSAGNTVGEVRFGSQTATLVHGQRHPEVVVVGADQKVSLTIAKTPSEGTYSFYRLVLSLAPDAEYLELINLSDQPVDVSGWMIEGEAVRGVQARFPFGSTIGPRGLLVAAVDAGDSQLGLENNGIDVRTVWEVPAGAKVVQLEFPGGNVTPDAEWLTRLTPPGTSPTLSLKVYGSVADEVELPVSPPPTPFQSIEKGDPSVVQDQDADGLDDGWYPSLKLYTPGATNDNDGLKEQIGLDEIVHDPSTEVTVANRAIESVGELAGLPSGIAWRAVTAQDLARLADQLTVEGLRLETEDSLIAGDADWHETVDGYEANRQGAVGTFQWTSVPDGQYRLGVYGWTGEQMSVRWQRTGGDYSDWIPTRSADAQGRIMVGQVTIGPEESPSQTLTLEIRCDSPGGVCHASHIMLDPQLVLLGMVNINTAPEEVLLSLPGMSEVTVQRLIAGRPYGDQDHKARGIGDLLAGAVLGESDDDRLARFRDLAHLITVRSHLFQISSVGEVGDGAHPSSSQRIQAIVERQ